MSINVSEGQLPHQYEKYADTDREQQYYVADDGSI